MPTLTLWILGAAVVALAILGYSTLALRERVSDGQRKLLMLLRLVFLLSLVGLMASPQVKREIESIKTAHLAILVDDSESMNLPASAETASRETRLQKITELLSDKSLENFSNQNLSLSIWRSSDLAPVSHIDDLSARSPRTELGDALQGLAEKFDKSDLQAIVLLSDGQNTSGDQPERIASDLDCPVFTVGFGSLEEGEQTEIEELILPEFAFQSESVPIEVVISQQGGGEDSPYPVQFKMMIDGVVVSEETLQFSPGQSRYEWSSDRIFERLGQHRIEVEIIPPTQSKSTTDRNNQWKRQASLTILKNRYQVLAVSGRPSWEMKYIKQAYEEDPRFNILLTWPTAKGRWIAVPSGKDSSREFASTLQDKPESETVISLLPSVDLLILGDLRTKNLPGSNLTFTKSELDQIANWVVQDGGNLLLLGGPEMFASSGDEFSELSNILPVNLLDTSDYRNKATFPRLTQFGQRSEALTALREVGLDALGPLEKYHELGKAKLGAEVLLETDDQTPLLTWQTTGKGRVMVLATSHFWGYGLPRVESLKDPNFLGQFWRDLGRFLILGRRGSGLRLRTNGRRFNREETVKIQAFFDSSLLGENPPTRIPISLSRVSESGEETLFLSQNPQIGTLYEGSFRPQQVGSYLLNLEFGPFSEERQIEVSAAREEHRRLNQDIERLKKIASASGGQYLAPGDFQSLPNMMDLKPRKETITRTVFFGSLPWVLPVLLAVLTLEWVLRKRQSLP